MYELSCHRCIQAHCASLHAMHFMHCDTSISIVSINYTSGEPCDVQVTLTRKGVTCEAVILADQTLAKSR